MSWLFVLAGQLKNLFPILLLAFVAGGFKESDSIETILALSAALLISMYALFYTFTFRFWVETNEIIIKEGLFDRTLRTIPFAKIQNIASTQSLLHRLFSVMEIQLESGAGRKPEAILKVLTVERARKLELEIRAYAHSASALPQRVDDAPESTQMVQADPIAIGPVATGPVESSVRLHKTPLSDLVRYGLIENKGMLVIGGGLYFLNQSGVLPKNVFREIASWVSTWLGPGHGPVFYLLTGTLSLLVVLVAVRIFSVLMAVFTFYDFTLDAQGDRLRVEHGLLSKLGGGTQKQAISAVVQRDGWLHRRFNRVSLRVLLPGNAGPEQGEQAKKGMRYLSPCAPPQAAAQLIFHSCDLDLSSQKLIPLHPRAAWRMSKWPCAGLLLAGLAVAGAVGSKFSLVYAAAILCVCFLLIAWSLYENQKNAAASGFSLNAAHLIIRTGWFSQETYIISREEIQTISLFRSPFDVRYDMAHVGVELRAGSMLEPPAVKYLPISVAQSLAQQLRVGIAQRELKVLYSQ